MGQTWVISILFSTENWFNMRLTVPGNEPSRQDNDFFFFCMFHMVQQDFSKPELMSLGLGTPLPSAPKDILWQNT